MGIGSSDKNLIGKQQGNLQTGLILVFPVEYCYLDLYHSVYINIVPHKALASVLISKNLAELAAEGS